MIGVKEKNEVYRCGVCGNMVETLHVGGGDLVCCEKSMELLLEKSQDEGQEKHVPVVEKSDQGMLVKVGSVQHPMEESHYIEWIQVLVCDKSFRKFLKPGDAPEVMVPPCPEKSCDTSGMKVREYCNKHGLWKK